MHRPNLMVKIPGTVEGVPAIRQCLWWLEMHPSASRSALIGMVEATEDRYHPYRPRATRRVPQ